MADIVVFGDSITWGAYDEELGGWVNRLNFFAKQKDRDNFVYNCGISGDTTDGLLIRFEGEARARTASHIIIAIGINDSFHDKTPRNGGKVPFERFVENLNKIAVQARAITNNVVFIGPTRVVESKTRPISWNDKVYYSNSEIVKYDKAIEDLCAQNKLQYLSMADIISEAELPDGLHPKAAGHQKMFERVRDALTGKWW